MKVSVLSTAEEDIAVGYAFHETVAPGLGRHFLVNIASDIDRLADTAGIHPKHHGYFRALSQVFAYAIFYEMNNDIVKVWAVLDTRQHPDKLVGRLLSGRRKPD